METASPLPSSYYCRTTSCVENPQATAMDALKAGDLRLLSDLLSEEGDRVEPDQQYPGETFKTLLQVAVEAGYTEAVKILLAGGARADHYNSALKLTALHVAARTGDPSVLALLLSSWLSISSTVISSPSVKSFSSVFSMYVRVLIFAILRKLLRNENFVVLPHPFGSYY